jgi:hypothetical protein
MLEREKPYAKESPIYGLYLIAMGERPQILKRKSYSETIKNLLELSLSEVENGRPTSEELLNSHLFQNKCDLVFIDKFFSSLKCN